MMEIRLQVILTGCIFQLYSELIRAQSYNHMTHQMKVVTEKPNDDSTIHENFQNLFDSIAESNTEKSEAYRKMLRDKVAENLRAFDTMNDELKIKRSRRTHGRGNFQDKTDNIMAIKREIDSTGQTSTFDPPIIIGLPRQYKNHFGTNHSNPKGVWKLARDDLVNMLGEFPDDPHEIRCTVIPKNSSSMICEICKKAGDQIMQMPYQLISATFLQGNLSFPRTRYEHEMRIDIIKCHCELKHFHCHEAETFYITKGREETSAWFLHAYYKLDDKESHGMRYILREPYVTW